MKPLLSYYGGKQRLAGKILDLIPSHDIYCEPFCGGAAVFYKLIDSPKATAHTYVLNDINDDLINMYRVAKSEPEAFFRLVDGTLHSFSDFKRAGRILKDPGSFDSVTRAWAFYVGTMQSFAKIGPNTGWARTKIHGRNLKAIINAISRVPEQIERLKKASIENCDAIKCIETWDTEKTFFLIDPPYTGAQHKYCAGYSIEEYQKLIDQLTQIKGQFILTNYAQDVSFPENWEVITNSVVCSASPVSTGGKKPPRTELFITNIRRRPL
jgi:DNA adenine methylase